MLSKKYKINFLGPIVYFAEKSSNETIFENCEKVIKLSSFGPPNSDFPHLLNDSVFLFLSNRTNAHTLSAYSASSPI